MSNQIEKQSIVIDNLLTEDIARNLSEEFHSDNYWRCNWHSSSKRDPDQWHWHREIWQDKKGLPEILPSEMEKHQSIKLLWDAVNDKLIQGYNLSFLPIRAYSNAHTYGLDGAPHTDDGEVTAIYYPVHDWDPEWEGGTALLTEDGDCLQYCRYKFNRLFAFPAHTLHKAMPLTKKCNKLRTVIVFKWIGDVDHELYSRWYNEQA